MKEQEVQINSDIAMAASKITKLTRDHYELSCGNQLGNLEETDKILETHNLQKRNYEKNQRINKEIKSVFQNTLIKKSAGLQRYMRKFYEAFKEKLAQLMPLLAMPQCCPSSSCNAFSFTNF